jgi:hypothetical protein
MRRDYKEMTPAPRDKDKQLPSTDRRNRANEGSTISKGQPNEEPRDDERNESGEERNESGEENHEQRESKLK